jgi:1-deoxy-D-xylulose-5-phosphate reductoisomerase
MAICNAANEIAVASFLAEEIRFTQIPQVIESTLERLAIVEPNTLSVVESADTDARRVAREIVHTLLQTPVES